MSAEFEARFPGTCARCDGPVKVGEPVRYEDDQIVHTDLTCEDRTSALAKREVCPRCWVEKPVSGECCE